MNWLDGGSSFGGPPFLWLCYKTSSVSIDYLLFNWQSGIVEAKKVLLIPELPCSRNNLKN